MANSETRIMQDASRMEQMGIALASDGERRCRLALGRFVAGVRVRGARDRAVKLCIRA